MPVITAYQFAHSPAATKDHVRAQVNPLFKSSAHGLVDGHLFAVADELSYDTQSTQAYLLWREELARVAGLAPAVYRLYGRTEQSRAVAAQENPGCPFHALLNFSPTDGALGPGHCAKLCRDFELHATRAQAMMEPDDFLVYQQFAALFGFARDLNGFVQFSHPYKRTGLPRKAYDLHEITRKSPGEAPSSLRFNAAPPNRESVACAQWPTR